jgi:hypothetical protein
MSDAIKLDVLDAITDEIQAVSGIKTVRINPPETITLEIALVPAVIVWDEEEEIEQRNRLEVGTFPLHMQLWLHGKTFWRAAENYRAAIKTRLYTSKPLADLGAIYKETKAEKFFHVDQLAGGIDTMGDVIYRTNALDATTQTF